MMLLSIAYGSDFLLFAALLLVGTAIGSKPDDIDEYHWRAVVRHGYWV